MRRILMAAACAGLLGATPAAAQDLQETLGRVLQGLGGGGQQQDQRYDPRQDQRGGGDRRQVYSDRWDTQDRARALDEADRQLDAQQRRIDEDRRRIEAERRRLSR